MTDAAGEGRVLTEIADEECYRLLGSQSLGRLAVVRDGRPEIFPVNYALDGRTVTLRTAPGVKLAFGSFSHVAFEVEDIDPVTKEGWVVEVRGFAEEITDAGDEWSVHARGSAVEPWVEGVHDHYLAIAHGEISGRRISRSPG
jgi:nitroimidazol reductase NimA-like FMN-containing flavoprotein (pyridoxamine 5'-phosphate oxidase superfamily)